MKIQCDVCNKDEASVFCVADEAALCAACDHRVHHANKLAGKHQRFSHHHPRLNKPLYVTSARECDISIHKTNEHTQKHTRFLLTGVKLSANAALYSISPSSAQTNNVSDAVPKVKSQDSKDRPVFVSPTNSTTSNSKGTTVQSSGVAAPGSCDNNNVLGGNLINSSSSISEYLMEMLPGWHVEDFLDSSFASPYGFCKNGDNDVTPLWDADLGSNMNDFPPEKMGIWVPQVASPLNQTQNQSYQSIELAFGATNGTKEQSKEFTTNNIRSSRKWSEDSSFVVPQISPPLIIIHSRKFLVFDLKLWKLTVEKGLFSQVVKLPPLISEE
ncbi:hypothetical protein DH2020_035005 [Rehmannia glutinosa]|uniref:B box-type domain-containing protein n=1 Tax=Rehmannia glutinosa TaxID=99300 RepID=A0ABR0V8K9_REHGL